MVSTLRQHEAVQALPYGFPEIWDGPRRSATQEALQLREGQLNGFEVGTIRP